MKIDVQFVTDPEQIRSQALAVLLRDAPREKDLCRMSLEKKSVIVAGPAPKDGQYGMLCAVAGKLYFQSMCFLSDGQKALYRPGTDVEIIPTPWGKLALCCGEDLFQPMYPRLAALKGCTILAARVAGMQEHLLIPGPWSACQSNCLPIALAQETQGQLILPCAMTEDHSGFGKSQVDTDALAAAYEEFPIFRSLNKGLYRRYEEVLL